MLRWRGGLRENRRVFACSLIAAESSGVKFLEEKTGLNGGNSNLSLHQRWSLCKKQTKGLVKCSFVACWFIDESEVSLVFTKSSIDEIRKNRRNI